MAELNPLAASVTVGGSVYQVLKPAVEGEPPEWDEAATMALVYRDHGEPPVATTPTAPTVINS